ncbi:GTP-binding protein [Bosea sp. RCC_152_1]|uniref:CobW family GTP-binding protein n=1 Tax=Bosea sp. RCC_152_1 TaxID=3239228 RepID=UPI0035256966
MDRRPAPSALAEFVLLTGPLGSGKTTLLSDHLALSATSDTGVIINDAGEVNVDGAIIGSDHRDLALATLSDGCICCSLGNSLQDGIDALLLARADRQLGPLRRIILETSGLAEPGPIVRSLRQVRQMDFNLRIITTFDASQSTDEDDFLPHYAAQLAAAQIVVLTKLDAVPDKRWPVRAAEVQRFNPLAVQVAVSRREERALAAFAGAGGHPPVISSFTASKPQPSRITIAFARWSEAASWEAIGEWIEDVSGYLGSRLLRLKGFVRPYGFLDPLLINGIGGAFSSPRPIRIESGTSLGLTMILRDVSKEEFIRFPRTASEPELMFK